MRSQGVRSPKMSDSRKLTRSTRRSYEREVARFAVYFRESFGGPPEGATEEQILRYAREHCKKYITSPGGLSVHIAAVKWWYTSIQKRSLSIPLSVPDMAPNPPRILDDRELDILFAHTRNHVCGIMLRLVYASGSRLGEVLRVRVQDIDFETYRLLLRRDSEHPDRYSVFPRSMKYELMRMAQLKQPGDYLFALRRTHEGRWEQISRRTLQQYITRASQDLGLGRITVQTLRDNFAIHLLRRAIDMRKISELMGFSSLRPIQRYKRFVPDRDIRLPSPLDG